jgi:hypothetical protein
MRAPVKPRTCVKSSAGKGIMPVWPRQVSRHGSPAASLQRVLHWVYSAPAGALAGASLRLRAAGGQPLELEGDQGWLVHLKYLCSRRQREPPCPRVQASPQDHHLMQSMIQRRLRKGPAEEAPHERTEIHACT